MRNAFLRSHGDDGFSLGIKIHIVVPLVPLADRQAKLKNSLRSRVPMVPRLLGCLHQFVDDVRRRRQVRISHPEVDNVLSGPPRLHLQLGNDAEDIRRQSFNAFKFTHERKDFQRSAVSRPR